MSFRLVPKSVTLNDLERRNRTVILSNSDGLRKSGGNVGQTTLKRVFSDILFIAIFAKVTKKECIMHRRSHVTGFRHYNITFTHWYFQFQLQV